MALTARVAGCLTMPPTVDVQCSATPSRLLASSLIDIAPLLCRPGLRSLYCAAGDEGTSNGKALL